MSRRKHIRGMTMVEILTATTISVMVVFAALTVFLSGLASWAQGQGRINAEHDSEFAVRKIAFELREAMAVAVDANGLGVTYRRPSKDSTGAFVVPATWDNVSCRIYYQDGKIMLYQGSTASVLATGVILTDPSSSGGHQSYQIFTAGAGSVTRAVTVMVATQDSGSRGKTVVGRCRETVYLRNIPELTN